MPVYSGFWRGDLPFAIIKNGKNGTSGAHLHAIFTSE
jgi:hypothetical protein